MVVALELAVAKLAELYEVFSAEPEHQRYITENYYRCTIEILSGLGQMYVADERFRNNIDRHGDGTAAFVSEAIAAFCAK